MNIKDYAVLAEDIVKQEYNTEVFGSKYLGGGSFGRVFLIRFGVEPYKAVLKIYLVPHLNENEKKDLEILASAEAVRVPKVYFLHNKSEGKADCLCMEYLEGYDCFTHIPFLFCGKKQKNKFAEAVTDVIIALHRNTNEKFGYARNPQYNTWQEFYKEYVADVLDKAREANRAGKFKTKILAIAEKAMRNFDFVFDEEVLIACLSHGDNNVMNIMADKKMNLIGFIDPLNALYCDPDYDLYQLGTLTGNVYKLVKTYKKKVAVSQKCDLKVAFYGIMQEVSCYVKTGKYTGFIMRSAIKKLNKEFAKHNLR